MTIGILYICTGNYSIFWKDFYLSCEKYFLPDAIKKYYVFTDSAEIEFEKENPNIIKIKQENLGWPNNTLMRYSIFLKNFSQWKNCDYSFFFNANLVFKKLISQDDFLPFSPYRLTACLHPGFYNKNKKKFTYEKRSTSLAYIEKGEHYFAGGINGGETIFFQKTINTINNNINRDLTNNIVAIWHDESHWNKFINENLEITKILDPGFLYPENNHLPFEEKIIIRDKRKYGGHNFLRGKNDWIKKYKNVFLYKLKYIYGNSKNFWRIG